MLEEKVLWVQFPPKSLESIVLIAAIVFINYTNLVVEERNVKEIINEMLKKYDDL